jgi:hypothetical protein
VTEKSFRRGMRPGRGRQQLVGPAVSAVDHSCLGRRECKSNVQAAAPQEPSHAPPDGVEDLRHLRGGVGGTVDGT